LIERDLDQQAARLTRAAELVETHRDFESVRDDGSFWERATTTVSNR
jgi:hypothetical protein